jgi:hypothetical protein
LPQSGRQAFSTRQFIEQPSPLVVLPSSQSSPVSTDPSPQAGAGQLQSIWQTKSLQDPVVLLQP